jgi:uncharacterized coiled-coil protein SlyX
MLVMQRVVVAKEEGEVKYLSNLLKDMQQQFLTRSS